MIFHNSATPLGSHCSDHRWHLLGHEGFAQQSSGHCKISQPGGCRIGIKQAGGDNTKGKVLAYSWRKKNLRILSSCESEQLLWPVRCIPHSLKVFQIPPCSPAPSAFAKQLEGSEQPCFLPVKDTPEILVEGEKNK